MVTSRVWGNVALREASVDASQNLRMDQMHIFFSTGHNCQRFSYLWQTTELGRRTFLSGFTLKFFGTGLTLLCFPAALAENEYSQYS